MRKEVRSSVWRLAAVVAGVAVLAAATTAAAQDCPRGTLDKRFCDRDGDLVADPPADAKRFVDPATLVFAYTPVEDPEVYRSVWDGFIQHMTKVTGKKVVFFAVQSNAAQIEAMRAGRLHIAGFNTGSNPLAVNCAGMVPFAMMASKDGSYGYEMEIITHVDSGIVKPADLKGRTLAFTSPTSNSGFKAPSALLKAEFGLVAERDFKPAFSGKHDNSILGAVNKDYDAAAIANSVLTRMIARKVVDGTKIRSIYKSQTFPTTGYGYVHTLKPELAAKVKEAFFSFPWEGSKLKAEFKKEDRFVPITYTQHWEVIRKIDAASGVSYACK
ncbi:MAG: phosphate/phosphite/phosphonate ABC transporter substrate-binding protein [Candidatus Rokubacteria bacterium]|nr:phosphate/phosphite/phosphonate ABC transporter substrate-binding protein [Candidatus Rokubacteria bacterium]